MTVEVETPILDSQCAEPGQHQQVAVKVRDERGTDLLVVQPLPQ